MTPPPANPPTPLPTRAPDAAASEGLEAAIQTLFELARAQPAEALARAEALLAQATPTPRESALLRRMRAAAAWRTGDVAQGMAWMRHAVDELAEHGSPQELTASLIHLGGALANLSGQFGAAIEVINRAIDLARQHADLPALGEALCILGTVYGRIHDMARSEQTLREALDIEPSRWPLYTRMMAHINLAFAVMRQDRAAEAVAMLLPLRQTLEQHMAPPAAQDRLNPLWRRLVTCDLTLAEAYGRLGRTDEALALLAQWDAHLGPEADIYLRMCQQQAKAEVLLCAGAAHEALALTRVLVAMARERGIGVALCEALALQSTAAQAAQAWAEGLEAERALRAAERNQFDAQTANSVHLLQAEAELRVQQAERAVLAEAHAQLEQRVHERTEALQREAMQRRQAEAQARHWVEHDWLTGLLSRTRLDAVLARLLAQPGPAQAAVLYIDLDGFKHVNDLYGHLVGDQVLRAAAMRLREAAGPGLTAARFGSDEFVVAASALPAEPAQAQTAATALAEHLLQALARPLRVAGHTLHLSASIGIALVHPGMASPEELLRQAERAMRGAKRAGGQRCGFLNPQLQADMQRRAELRRDLPQALAQGALQAWWQPMVAAHSGQALGLELLARWQHPRLGWVQPREFVALAAESSAIDALGQWSMARALALAAWLPAESPLRLSVNLSTAQLARPGLAQGLAAQVAQANSSPSRFVFDITESLPLGEDDGFRDRVAQLRAHGFALALDDFGHGYSSFVHLGRMGLDHLKIDPALVRAGALSDQGRVLVDAVVAMARSLNVAVAAEGVETPAEQALLRRSGVGLMQGHLIAPAMGPDELLPWLRARRVALTPVAGAGDAA